MNDSAHEHGTFCWYDCGSRNVDAAQAFYTQLFGWGTVEHEMPGGQGGVYTVFQHGGKDVGGLFALAGPIFEGVPSHWAAYIWVDDVDTAAAQVAGLGGEVLSPPFDVPGVGRMSVIKDPTGAVLHLWKGSEGAGCQVTDGSPGAFCWSELATPDTQAAGDFYTKLIGWTTSQQDMPGGLAYTMFHTPQGMAGGMLAMEGERWKGVPPHWMNYVAVADTDATAAKAGELGGKVLMPPMDIPGVGRFAVLQDPSEATLSVITPQQPPQPE